MKIDIYKHKEKYLNWKAKVVKGIPEISKSNSDILVQYLSDMECGLNVSSKSVKGARSYSRLNNLKQRMVFLAKQLELRFNTALTDIKEDQLFEFFNAMRNGLVKRKDKKCYQAVADYVKAFKAFWHWHMKVNKKTGKTIIDITEDLDVSRNKPRWVYLTEDQVRKLCEHSKPEYRVLIMFLYDTGIRSPGELVNLRVSDIYDNFKRLNIRDEIVKKGSFGRNINLMLCSDLLKSYVADNCLEPNDQIFRIDPSNTNRYLKRLAARLFGEKDSLAGDKYSNLTMYDFRHCSCCYWLPRYKSESALKYRFGWKKSDKIHYYSELLGMRDTIQQEDLLLDITKTEIEKRLLKTEQENQILRDKIKGFNSEVIQLKSLMKVFLTKMKQQEEIESAFGQGGVFTSCIVEETPDRIICPEACLSPSETQINSDPAVSVISDQTHMQESVFQ